MVLNSRSWTRFADNINAHFYLVRFGLAVILCPKMCVAWSCRRELRNIRISAALCGHAGACAALAEYPNSWWSSAMSTSKPAMNPRHLASVFRGRIRPGNRSNWQAYWICKSCRSNAQPRVSFSSSGRSFEKPYYVTTPIFYVNAGNSTSLTSTKTS